MILDKNRRFSHSSANLILNVNFGVSSPGLTRKNSVSNNIGIMSPTLRQRPSKVDTEIGELNSDGTYVYTPRKLDEIKDDSNPENDITSGARLMRVFQKQLKKKVESTAGLHKPAWGKHVPKA